MIEAIFIDRDGTIGGTTHVEFPGAFNLYKQAKKAMDKLTIPKFAFTNQPAISRGEITRDVYETELRSFGFDDVYICPHTHLEGCDCRKPGTGMLESAQDRHGLNLNNCVVIGDRWSDVLAGIKVGAVSILVMTGAGNDALGKYRHKWSEYEPDFIAIDLLDAVEWLEKKNYLVSKTS